MTYSQDACGIEVMRARHPKRQTYQSAHLFEGRCQTKAIRYPKIVMHPLSGRKLPPLGQGSGAILLEDVAAVEVAVLVEVVVD